LYFFELFAFLNGYQVKFLLTHKNLKESGLVPKGRKSSPHITNAFTESHDGW